MSAVVVIDSGVNRWICMCAPLLARNGHHRVSVPNFRGKGRIEGMHHYIKSLAGPKKKFEDVATAASTVPKMT